MRISGGANVLQQYLRLGVIEELEIALAPVMFGGGRRLFEDVAGPEDQVEDVINDRLATHLRYWRA
jgi:dihydrofolate reductase